MVNLTARDGVGNTLKQEHPSMGDACMAADILRHDGWNDILMEESPA